MDVYVDDMIIKSKTASTHMAGLAETFRMLKRFNMHLNISKCIFGVSSRKFLEFIIHQRGIDTNPEKEHSKGAWTLHVDGSAIIEVIGVGLILKSPSRETYERSFRLQFRATNNEAKYEALLHGLCLTLEMHVGDLEVFNDSQLLMGHVNRSYKARDPTMVQYLTETR
ncbi:uncharacterized protein LOC135636383 [Musa acuminata AAA Group]|uniref:uncharacterized protein LOC135636383 n=1 Tax=Musa acuminata AAA Group TaxID=214697 RepID=UPI0031D8BA54